MEFWRNGILSECDKVFHKVLTVIDALHILVLPCFQSSFF
jgi:hypothetical protein